MKTQITCRFPGCDAPAFGRTQERGLHELRAHKMRNGKVPAWKLAQEAKKAKAADQPISTVVEQQAAEAPAPPPAPEQTLIMTAVGPRRRIEDAIEELNQREATLLVEVERLEGLKQEVLEVGHQKTVLSEALSKLTVVIPQDGRAKSQDGLR